MAKCKLFNDEEVITLTGENGPVDFIRDAIIELDEEFYAVVFEKDGDSGPIVFKAYEAEDGDHFEPVLDDKTMEKLNKIYSDAVDAEEVAEQEDE